MAEKVFEFGLGDNVVKIALPEEKVIHEIEGRSVAPIEDIPKAVQEALRNPIDSPPLSEVVRHGDKVAVIVSDITRSWGRFDHFLPTLLDEINLAGVPDSDIDIVISLGTHRPHTPQEDIIVCGESVCRRVKVHQHDAHDMEKLVYTGTTTRGTKCYLNKTVAQADKIILTGGITYHLMAGFGAGRKAIMPGVSANVTIQSNHCIALSPEVGKAVNEECASGKLEGNPMHEDMTEAAAFAKPAFLLNAVFTPEGKFAKFVAGHWYKAWEKGTKAVEAVFGIPISAQADLVIASAGGFPKDINLYQGMKAIDNAFMATKPGGVLICFLECRDIYEPAEFSNWFKYDNMLEHEMALRENFTIPGFIALKFTKIATTVSLIIVSKPENAEFIKNAGAIPATSAEEAIAIARAKLGQEEYTITVMAHAANTVPILK